MATAGNHKIIIEKGADFDIDIQISENGIVHKDVEGYTVTMTIKSANAEGVITTLDTITGSIIPDNPEAPTLDWTYLNGYVNVNIDRVATAGYATLLPITFDPFATSYEYFYSIDINGGDSDDIRVLRGKCAVREG